MVFPVAEPQRFFTNLECVKISLAVWILFLQTYLVALKGANLTKSSKSNPAIQEEIAGDEDLTPQQIVDLINQYNKQVSQSSPLCLCVVTDLNHNQLATVRVKRLACLAFDKINGDKYIVDPEPI